jgi:CheY-like chemotaxis protein
LRKPIETHELLDRSLRALTRLIDRPRARLMLAGRKDDRQVVIDCIAEQAVEIVPVESAAEFHHARQQGIDGVVVCGPLPDLSLVEIARALAGTAEVIHIPLIVFSPVDKVWENEDAFNRLVQSAAVRHVCSPERLLDQVTLCLHRPTHALPPQQRERLAQLHQNSTTLAGKKVLVVDDDIRNIFALTSVLEQHKINVLSAETGRAAIEVLQQDAEVDIVLMDIMMPEMDGLDTMRAIRKLPQFKNLPMIAVTAKAMKGDREKCIDAGAWDYLSKPVDTEQMLAALRAWLHR